MKTTWEILVDCLRSELEQYGSLLHLLQEQQTCLFLRNTDRLPELATAVYGATGTADPARRRREENFRAFATAQGCAPDATIRSLLSKVEAPARPLLEALVGEINRLIYLTRRFARQNHELFARAYQMQQEFLRQICPGRFNPTYSVSGQVRPATSGAKPGRLAAC